MPNEPTGAERTARSAAGEAAGLSEGLGLLLRIANLVNFFGARRFKRVATLNGLLI